MRSIFGHQQWIFDHRGGPDSAALANHIAIRDYLRKNQSTAREYGALKKRLASEYSTDIDGYIEGKTKFLLRILGEVGFGQESLDEIERMNKKPEM